MLPYRDTVIKYAEVLRPSVPGVYAITQVAAVQREFVEKLLTKAVFQRHMTAVREVLNMLRFAQKIRDDGELWDNTAIKVCVLGLDSLLTPAAFSSLTGSHIEASVLC